MSVISEALALPTYNARVGTPGHAGIMPRRAIGKQNLNTDWQLRKVASVGARPRVLGRPRIEATDLVVGDDFSVWSAHRQTLVTGWGRIRVGDRC